MPSVHLSDISFAYRDSVPLFDAASATFGPGWTGLVGANGAGKTTLLQIVAGALEPDRGSVDVPRDVVFCPQIVDEPGPEVFQFAAAWDGDAFTLRGRLELDPDELGRWSTLSPGERKRWQVGAALIRDPDVLLLDEPTNHIDVATRDLLVASLHGYRGIGVIVSHDRRLLNELCVRTARIHRTAITIWNGPYDVARLEWERAAAGVASEKDALRAEERRLHRLADRQRRAMEVRQRSDRRSRRQAGAKDSDARSMEKKKRQAGGAKAASADLNRVAARAERTGAAAEQLFVDKPLGTSVFVDYEPPGRRVLLSHHGPLVAGDTVLVPEVEVRVERSSRIWLRGVNGAGKTTLLRALVEGSSLPDGKLLWLPQDQTAAERRQVLRIVETLAAPERGLVLNVVAALGVDPDQVLASELPSPGEARKLTLALGLARHAWCVVLDEPTNHLDLPSIERFEVALAEYPGALVVVSHDERFATAITDHEWVLADGALIES